MLYTKIPSALYSCKQLKLLEDYVMNEYAISPDILMQAAGQDAFMMLRQAWPAAKSIAVICGGGNNAGDGYVLAGIVHQAQLMVTVYYLAEPSQLTGAAKMAAAACMKAGVKLVPFPDAIAKLDVDLVVDAILGTGLSREVTGNFAAAISWVNAQTAPVLALDLPSGLEGDTGKQRNQAVTADMTICFLGCQRGLFTADGIDCAGRIVWSDLNIPKAAYRYLPEGNISLMDDSGKVPLPLRRANSCKGDYGHVLIIGGNYGMAGSVCLAANAALHSGAGLVTVATRPEHVAAVIAHRPEAMCYGIDNGVQLENLIVRATVIVLGPGLGQDAWAYSLWQQALGASKPLIIDADGLNFLAAHPQHGHSDWVLTPHPGEAARLLETNAAAIQSDRFAAGQALQQKFNGINVLKGAGTIVTQAGLIQKVCQAGNPGMATAGMGDLLSGIIAGLLAQHLQPAVATNLGVWVHSKAGDYAANLQGERGLMASHLLPFVTALLNMHVR